MASEASELDRRLPVRAALTPRGYPGEAAWGPSTAPESGPVSPLAVSGSAEPLGLPLCGKQRARGGGQA